MSALLFIKNLLNLDPSFRDRFYGSEPKYNCLDGKQIKANYFWSETIQRKSNALPLLIF